MIKWLKRLFAKKPAQKKVLEKIKVTKPFKQKHAHSVKKCTKKAK